MAEDSISLFDFADRRADLDDDAGDVFTEDLNPSA